METKAKKISRFIMFVLILTLAMFISLANITLSEEVDNNTNDKVKLSEEDLAKYVDVSKYQLEKPKVKNKVKIKYPEKLKTLKIGGIVEIITYINEEGKVVKVKSKNKDTHEDLVKTAVQTISNMEFEPYIF